MVYKVRMNIIVTTKQKPIIDTQKVKKTKPKVKKLKGKRNKQRTTKITRIRLTKHSKSKIILNEMD